MRPLFSPLRRSAGARHRLCLRPLASVACSWLVLAVLTSSVPAQGLGDNEGPASDHSGLGLMDLETWPADNPEPDAEGEEDGLDYLLENGTGANAGSPVAQFTCEFRDDAVAGVPVINGRVRPYLVTVTLTETGSAVINGTVIAPARTSPVTPSAQTPVRGALFPVREVQLAAKSSISDAPPVIGMSENEMRQLRAFEQFGLALNDRIMAGRERYMGVMLDMGTVGFFDRGPNDEAVNGSTLNCVRTM